MTYLMFGFKKVEHNPVMN